MDRFEVVPGRRLGPVEIDAHRSAVVASLGTPASVQGDRSLYWDLPPLRVDLDASDGVEFVELSWTPGGPAALLGDLDLLGGPADLIADALAERGGRLEEQGHSLVCSGLALWRPVLPEEAVSDDEYRGGQHWATVAVARAGYWEE